MNLFIAETAAASPPISGPAEWLTAQSTVVLAVATCVLAFGIIGVFIAAKQLRQERYNADIERTLDVIKEWNTDEIQDYLKFVDLHPCELEKSRRFAYWCYRRWKGGKYSKQVYGFIGDLCRLTEKMDILLTRGLIDGEVLTESIGYEILQAFYAMQDVFADEAQLGYDFLGYWHLWLKLVPFYTQLPDETRLYDLVIAQPRIPTIPPRGSRPPKPFWA